MVAFMNVSGISEYFVEDGSISYICEGFPEGGLISECFSEDGQFLNISGICERCSRR